MLKRVQEEPFVPIAFQKEHKGMQGTDYFEGKELAEAQRMWSSAAFNASVRASELSEFGVTKQLANRQLEPFLYHTVICTGTEWSNFFALRAHPQAEIHIADLAEKMLVAYNDSTPRLLREGEWHIPFGDTFDIPRLHGMVDGMRDNIQSTTGIRPDKDEFTEMIKVKIATARCARVSYLNFEGKDDYQADIKLHNMLRDSGHMSPFEHCAMAMNMDVAECENEWSANFHGFEQYRKMQDNENKSDLRVLIK